MASEKSVGVLLVGDQSFCLEHLVKPYFKEKTGEEPSLEECPRIGIPFVHKKQSYIAHIHVAPTKSENSRLPLDKERRGEYKKIEDEIHIVVFCYYTNNSRTLANIKGKYSEEVNEWFSKASRYVLGVDMQQKTTEGKRYLRHTVSTQDKFLKKEMDVESDQVTSLVKSVKAKKHLKCSVVIRDDENANSSYIVDDSLLAAFDTPVKKFIKSEGSCTIL